VLLRIEHITGGALTILLAAIGLYAGFAGDFDRGCDRTASRDRRIAPGELAALGGLALRCPYTCRIDSLADTAL
jgi:hypothetical protein